MSASRKSLPFGVEPHNGKQWKFLHLRDGVPFSQSGNEYAWTPGEWHGPIRNPQLCERGLHASAKIEDARGYVQGPICAKVSTAGEWDAGPGGDKTSSAWMRLDDVRVLTVEAMRVAVVSEATFIEDVLDDWRDEQVKRAKGYAHSVAAVEHKRDLLAIDRSHRSALRVLNAAVNGRKPTPGAVTALRNASFLPSDFRSGLSCIAQGCGDGLPLRREHLATAEFVTGVRHMIHSAGRPVRGPVRHGFSAVGERKFVHRFWTAAFSAAPSFATWKAQQAQADQ